ncbi:MAG: tRNA (N(6)-L-threonylcarbamoyladenosine(37)-C(2))-methylthiotransferase MtaB [Parachlamydiaceae bacterium]
MNKRFKVVTLGCRTNQYESQGYQDQLVQLGFSQAKESETAEICIVNTCTVTESADSSSRHAIRQLARENPGAKIVVTGCFAERQPETAGAIEGVSLVVSNKEKEQLVNKLFPEEEIPEFSIKRFEAHTRAFVKVQDGCNSFCTYCIIPYVRGRSRSRTVQDVVSEVEELIRNGYKEVVLTGINIGDFDGAPKEGETVARLSDLVRQVDAVPGLKRLRISSIDPDEVDPDLTDAVVSGRHTCRSMHIVLQSGSNVILKRMNRKYTRHEFMETVDRLKSIDPDFTFTTDIIVGFPGETEEDFQETLEVMREVKFAKVHMFPYSDRPRTRSNLMPNKVPKEVIQRRKAELLELAENQSYALREQFIGRRMTVLTESKEKEGWILGHTDNFLPVLIESDAIQPNELIDVELIENTPAGLIGKRC